jgi:hypothetical protein
MSMTQIEILWKEHADWSQATFGTDQERGPIGALRHLKLEADEAIESPRDIIEYADCLLLLLDAARRAGFSLEQLVCSARVKLDQCRTRKYPKPEADVPSLHLKE